MRVLASTVAAIAMAALAAAGDHPEMVHIALAGADAQGFPNALTLSWQTANATPTSVCEYSTSPTLAGASTVQGTQSSYYATWQHHARTGPLSPSTTYYYRCGDAQQGFSAVFNATTNGGAAQTSVSVLQVGDLGVYNSYFTRKLIRELAPTSDMLLWSGDICYADDAFLHDPLVFGYEETWDTCQRWFENVTVSTPFMVAPGNHEAECHSAVCLLDETKKAALHNFSAYTHRFAMPSAESQPLPGVLNQWHTYTLGPVRFIHFDSETSFPNAPNDSYTGLPNGGFGDQVAWMKATLEHANSPAERALHPWVIATTHRPLYSLDSCGDDGQPHGSSADLAAAFEDMLYQNGVDVHFSGHVHAYERQHPVYKNKLDPNAPTYIVSGSGGNTEEHSDLHAKPGALWSAAFNTVDYGIGRFTANATSLHWEFLRGTDGAVLDSVTLTK